MYIRNYHDMELGKIVIEGRINSLLAKLSGAWIVTAFVKEDTSLRLACGRVVFTEGIYDSSTEYDYDRVILHKEWIDIERAKDLVSMLFDNTWFYKNMSVEENLISMQENITFPVENSVSGWKEYLFSTRAKSDSRIEYKYDPLVAYNCPAFDKDTRAIAEWVLNDPSRENALRDTERLEIIIPDKKARIESVHWTPEGILVRTEGSKINEKMCLKIVEINGKSRNRSDHLVEMKDSSNDSVEIPFKMDRVESVELYLVSVSDELLDYAKLRSTGGDYETPDGELTIEDVAALDIEAGESDFVEFKPWIILKDPKEAQIVKTIVAFANSSGGHLYIGVNDDGTVQKGSDLRKAYKCDLPEALDKASERIQRLVSESLEPIPVVTVTEVAYGGESILLVDVEEGKNSPYATHDHDIYIRRGATSRKPAPSEELLYLFQKSNKVQ